MKNPELFHKTVGILVKAYFNNTLVHGDPCGCAIGNLIADNLGYKIVKNKNNLMWIDQNDSKVGDLWGCVHNYGEMSKVGVYEKEDVLSGKRQLISTGYNIYQTCAIEKAFEVVDNSVFVSEEDDMFNRLMSVVDCLSEIHQATHEEAKQAKELFTLTA